MTLQSQEDHPHGVSDAHFDAIFTASTPVIFAYHGYPQLIHRLTYKRANHKNFHVHGFMEEGTTTTPFDMVVRNELDRFHLAIDAIHRLPGLPAHTVGATQRFRDRLIDHRRYVTTHGEDSPDIATWAWPYATAAETRGD
jgi:xylulose-5-phosphate/fructose-6-phosphate phosphoketolase